VSELALGQLVWAQEFGASEGSQMCGRENGNWNELVVPIEVELDTDQDFLTITVETNLNSAASDESWGLASVEILPQLFGYFDKFSADSNDWLMGPDALAETTSVCGSLGSVLGGFQVAGKGVFFEKEYDLAAMPHDMLKLDLDFIALDTWDGEAATLTVDGIEVWSWTGRTNAGGGVRIW
jgi:hypothetical protein